MNRVVQKMDNSERRRADVDRWWQAVEASRKLLPPEQFGPETTPEALLAAGAPRRLADSLAEYRRSFQRRLPLDELAAHAKYEVDRSDGEIRCSVVIVNEPAYHLLCRQTPKLGPWRGMCLRSDWLGLWAEYYHRLAFRTAGDRSRINLELAEILAAAKTEVIFLRQLADVKAILRHELIHAWQRRFQFDWNVASKVNLRSPLYKRAVLHLVNYRGYQTSSSTQLWDEVGAHLGSGDCLGCSSTDAYDLAVEYFGAYSNQAMLKIPSDHPVLRFVLRARGLRGPRRCSTHGSTCA